MLGPLVMILILSMLKDAYEDYQRYKADVEDNQAECEKYDNITFKWTKTTWSSLKVGEIVRVKKDEAFPADLLIVRSEGDDG
jgi:P-type E1-E2 ATPase